jgi:hypothetical protein
MSIFTYKNLKMVFGATVITAIAAIPTIEFAGMFADEAANLPKARNGSASDVVRYAEPVSRTIYNLKGAAFSAMANYVNDQPNSVTVPPYQTKEQKLQALRDEAAANLAEHRAAVQIIDDALGPLAKLNDRIAEQGVILYRWATQHGRAAEPNERAAILANAAAAASAPPPPAKKTPSRPTEQNLDGIFVKVLGQY